MSLCGSGFSFMRILFAVMIQNWYWVVVMCFCSALSMLLCFSLFSASSSSSFRSDIADACDFQTTKKIGCKIFVLLRLLQPILLVVCFWLTFCVLQSCGWSSSVCGSDRFKILSNRKLWLSSFDMFIELSSNDFNERSRVEYVWFGLIFGGISLYET